MSRIQHYLAEIKNIKAEVKRHNQITKTLKARQKELENEIAMFMDGNNKNSMTCANTTICVKDVSVRGRKKKSEKQQEIVRILKNNGVHNSEQVYQDILGTTKGHATVKKKLHITNTTDGK